MIQVYITFYVITKDRILRFTRESKLISVPFIGSSVSFEDGRYEVDSVEFVNNSDCVTLVVKDDSNGNPQDDIDDDSKVEEIINDYESCGWTIASNVERSKYHPSRIR
jgi:hypothetical protein